MPFARPRTHQGLSSSFLAPRRPRPRPPRPAPRAAPRPNPPRAPSGAAAGADILNFCCGSKTLQGGSVQGLVCIFFRVVGVVGVGCGSGGDEESSGGVHDLDARSPEPPASISTRFYVFTNTRECSPNILSAFPPRSGQAGLGVVASPLINDWTR